MFQKLSHHLHNKAKQLLSGSADAQSIEKAVRLFLKNNHIQGEIAEKNIKNQKGTLILTVHSQTLKHQLYTHKNKLLKHIQETLPTYTTITKIRFQ